MSPNRPFPCCRAVASLALILGLWPAAAAAAPEPPVIALQGWLRANGGGPVADGKYPMVFRVYDAADAAKELWKGIHLGVEVVGGRFEATLGKEEADAPLAAQLFADHEAMWLGIQVSTDPELARVRLHDVPTALFARVAGSLAGALSGKQIEAGSLPDSALGFSYAKSDAKAGDALGLKCSGCITAGHIAEGTLDAKSIGYSNAGQSSTVHAALAALDTVVHIQDGHLGVGKNPAGLCALDLASDGGLSCIDGAPALWTRVAGSDAEMQKFATAGQLVFRKDTADAWINANGSWRRLLMEAICGDGKTEVPEECDDGKANGNGPDECRLTCKKPSCGDLIVDGGEACDDGNTDNVDACVGCKTAACGDGYLHAGVEDCDDGNEADTDACTAKCVKNICGDGHVNAGVEACDDGDANADAPNKCRKDCSLPKCGDAILDKGEECDDGNNAGGDGCSATCISLKPKVLTGVGSGGAKIPIGTIAAKAGATIVIDKLGICGDADASSGPVRYHAFGGGLDFTWAAGQNNNPGSTHFLPPTQSTGGQGRGFTYADVNYKAQVGQSVSVEYEFTNDGDGLHCTGTDVEGNSYNDSKSSSSRGWVRWHYE